MMPMIDEATRHALHDYFISQMGREMAGAFMSLLPTVAWGDIATEQNVVAVKQEMAVLEVRLNQRFDERLDDKLAATEARLRTEMAGLRTEMYQGFRRMTVWVASLHVASLVAFVAVATRLG